MTVSCYKAQAMRISTYDKPRVIACAEDHPRHIGLPRGCLDEVYHDVRGAEDDAEGRDRSRCLGHAEQRDLASIRDAQERPHCREGDQSLGGRGDEGVPGGVGARRLAGVVYGKTEREKDEAAAAPRRWYAD